MINCNILKQNNDAKKLCNVLKQIYKGISNKEKMKGDSPNVLKQMNIYVLQIISLHSKENSREIEKSTLE